MPKLNQRPPKLSKEGNYAVVYCNGGRVQMGRWGSEDAQKNYLRFITEWAANPIATTIKPGAKANVEDLVLAFLRWAEKNIDYRDFGHARTASQVLIDFYAGIAVDEFGPKALAAVQKHLESTGRFSRRYCNKLVSVVRRMFRWGVAQEMVPETIAAALKYVQPLREGKTTAPENDNRREVPDDVIERTLCHLLPTVAAMVTVQRYAAMRPNEVCRMTVGDLDMTGEIWIYRPGKHKGAWRGHHKAVALGKPEQEIILPRLEGKGPENAVFSPRDTMAERHTKQAAERKTPMTPSQRARADRRAKNPRHKVREHYDSQSYARSIKESIERANRTLDDPIPHWTPYQLRHAGVTEISKTDGLDVAQAVAGHRSPSMTARYDHSQLEKAVEHAKKRSRKSKDA